MEKHMQHGSGTWLGDNLLQFRNLEEKLEHLETQRDAIPSDFVPREFLMFIRGSVNEIKRLTAENYAFREALKEQNANQTKTVEEDVITPV